MRYDVLTNLRAYRFSLAEIFLMLATFFLLSSISDGDIPPLIVQVTRVQVVTCWIYREADFYSL